MPYPKAAVATITTDAQVIDPAQVRVLVTFPFKASKTRGVVAGLRFGAPKNLKASKDFPGTDYKIVTESAHPVPKQVYRYVPLDRIVKFLKDTDSNAVMLDRILGPFAIIPQAVEFKAGDRVVISGAEGVVTEDGEVVMLADGKYHDTYTSADAVAAGFATGAIALK